MKKSDDSKKKAKLSKAAKKKLAESKEDFGSPDALTVRSQSSVEFSRDKKGEASYKVKVYEDDPTIAAKMALEVAKILDAKIKADEDKKKK